VPHTFKWTHLLIQVSEQGVAAGANRDADLNFALLDNPGFVEGLLSWQLTVEQSIGLQNRYRELFPGDGYSVSDPNY